MNLVELSIEYHCNVIKRWVEKEKSLGKIGTINGSIWYIIVGFDDSSLHGPYYMGRDSEMLKSVFGDNYVSLDRYMTDKSMILGVCYFGLSKNKSMFDFYQQERKWKFLSFVTSGKKNLFSSVRTERT